MASRALNLMVGASLKIEPVNGELCYLVELIGYVIDKSLIVTLAYAEGDEPALKAGDLLAVRYLGSEKSYAFYSEVISVSEAPYPHLHLSYPKGVQGLAARRVPRVPVEGAAMHLNIVEGKKLHSVVMADISTCGARLISESRLGNCGERFVIELPDISSAGHNRLSLPCSIRHVQEQYPNAMGQPTLYHHGVEFEQLDESAQLFIARFIRDSVAQAEAS